MTKPNWVKYLQIKEDLSTISEETNALHPSSRSTSLQLAKAVGNYRDFNKYPSPFSIKYTNAQYRQILTPFLFT